VGVMAIFKLTAKKVNTSEPVKVEGIKFLGMKSRGFTSERTDSYLVVEATQNGRLDWYAKKAASKVDAGRSAGGNILISVD